jgi:hypothetical protein
MPLKPSNKEKVGQSGRHFLNDLELGDRDYSVQPSVFQFVFLTRARPRAD